MKFKLLILFLLSFASAKAQTVAFFGEAVCKTKIDTLYYRFDNEEYTAQQSTAIELSLPYGERFKNSYRLGFSEKDLRAHKYLYFSGTAAISSDSALVRQNRIDLAELFISLDALTAKPSNVNINNDLLLEDNFDRITSFPRNPSAEETKYTGDYTASSNSATGTTEITLDSSKVYHARHSKETPVTFLMDEEVGYWDLGKYHANPDMDAIKIRYIYRFNRRIGNKMLPADAGGSYDIIIKGDRLLYPTGFETLHELKRK